MGTIGCKPVLDELAVDVEGAEHVGKEEEDLVLGRAGWLGDVRRDAGDGLRVSDGCAAVGDGLEAVVAGHGGCGCVDPCLSPLHHGRQ